MVETDLITLGVLVIIVGFVLAFIGILYQAKGKAKVEGGGIFFIGPFPILGVATSERTFYILIVITVIFLVVFILLNYLR